MGPDGGRLVRQSRMDRMINRKSRCGGDRAMTNSSSEIRDVRARSEPLCKAAQGRARAVRRDPRKANHQLRIRRSHMRVSAMTQGAIPPYMPMSPRLSALTPWAPSGKMIQSKTFAVKCHSSMFAITPDNINAGAHHSNREKTTAATVTAVISTIHQGRSWIR